VAVAVEVAVAVGVAVAVAVIVGVGVAEQLGDTTVAVLLVEAKTMPAPAVTKRPLTPIAAMAANRFVNRPLLLLNTGNPPWGRRSCRLCLV
jgi:hypothetical protein